MVIEYLTYAKKYKAEMKQIKAHVMKMLYKSIEVEKELMQGIICGQTFEEIENACFQIIAKRTHLSVEDQFGWYSRHMYKNIRSVAELEK